MDDIGEFSYTIYDISSGEILYKNSFDINNKSMKVSTNGNQKSFVKKQTLEESNIPSSFTKKKNEDQEVSMNGEIASRSKPLSDKDKKGSFYMEVIDSSLKNPYFLGLNRFSMHGRDEFGGGYSLFMGYHWRFGGVLGNFGSGSMSKKVEYYNGPYYEKI